MPWTVQRHLSRWELRLLDEPAPAGRPVRFADLAAARGFLRPLLGDSFAAAALRDAARRVALGRSGDRDLVDALAAELVAGRLLVVDPGDALASRQLARAEPARRPEAPDVGDLFAQLDRRQDSDWIEVQLVDRDDRGLAHTRYEIVTADGVVHRGYTDALGLARLTRIPSGDCQVRFPDLDARDWSPA